MTGVTTRRVSGDITENKTKRVPISGAVTDVGGDFWGKSWGGFVSLAPAAELGKTWGASWSFIGFISQLIPSLIATFRVTGAITKNIKKRITEVPASTLV